VCAHALPAAFNERSPTRLQPLQGGITIPPPPLQGDVQSLVKEDHFNNMAWYAKDTKAPFSQKIQNTPFLGHACLF